MTLRVLHLTTVATPIAGAELTSLLLARELPAEDVELEVCTISGEGQLHERLAAVSRHASNLGAEGPAQSLQGLVRLERRLRAFRPHIIHAQLFHAGVLAAAAAKPARIPFVLTRQYEYTVKWFRGKLANRADAWAVRQAHTVVAISSQVKRFLQREFALPAERIRVVHNAADVDRLANLSREDVASTPNDGVLRMAYVATLNPSKGHTHLLGAMSILKKQGARVRLLLVGDGAERAALEEIVRAGALEDAVSFLGWRDDVGAILATAHLYVHSAREEAFGIAIAEAMAAGLPVVASNVGGIPDVVVDGETGYLVPAENAEALAAKLALLIGDPALRRKMGDAGKARAFALFSPRKMAQSYAAVFRDVASANRLDIKAS